MGDHSLFIYDNFDQEIELIIYILNNGIEKKEKCLCIIEKINTNFLINLLKKKQDIISIETYISFLTYKEALKGQSFNYDKNIFLFFDLFKSYIDYGFYKICVINEAVSILNYTDHVDKLIKFESDLNFYIPNLQISLFCLYNENRIPLQMLTNIIFAHPFIVNHNKRTLRNPYHIEPSEFDFKKKALDTSIARDLINKIKNLS